MKQVFDVFLSSICITWLQVTSINNKPLHDFKPNCLVRFRGMIQDSYEPEFYLETYHVVNKITSEKVGLVF